jgi:hypothetical protein
MMTLPSLAALAIIVYFAFLFLTLIYRSRVMNGPWLFLLRSFFPNWRFFHRVGHVPVLFVRYCDKTAGWQPWQCLTPRARRNLLQLFHNPAINLALANQNLVDHLSADIQALPDDKDSRQLVTYKLVLRLARYYLQPISMQQDISEFQIALQLIPPFEIETAALAAESTILTSPAIAW